MLGGSQSEEAPCVLRVCLDGRLEVGCGEIETLQVELDPGAPGACRSILRIELDSAVAVAQRQIELAQSPIG